MLKFKVTNHDDFGRMRYALNNGEVVFSVTDIVRSLGLPNTSVIDACVDEGDVNNISINEIETGRIVNERTVNLCGIQSLLSACHSKVDIKKFKKWVVKDISSNLMNISEISEEDAIILRIIHANDNKTKAENLVKYKEIICKNLSENKSIPCINTEIKASLKGAEKTYNQNEIRDMLGISSKYISHYIRSRGWSNNHRATLEAIKDGYCVEIKKNRRYTFVLTEKAVDEINESFRSNNLDRSNKHDANPEMNLLNSADITGFKFGKLKVIGKYDDGKPVKNMHGKWICECECGKTTTPTKGNLISGNTKSCGHHGKYINK